MAFLGNRRMALTGLLALPFIIILVMAAIGPSVQASGVNVFDVQGKNYYPSIDASENATFQYVVYNNDSSPFLLKLNVSGVDSNGINPVFEQNFITINPGESSAVRLTMIPNRDLATTDTTFNVIFTFTQMNDPTNNITITKEASMHVESTYGAKAGQNKIFGIWQNNLPPPFESNYGAFIVTLLGWMIIALVVMFVVDPVIHFMTRKTETQLDDILLWILRYPVFIFIVAYGIVINSLEILNLPRPDVKMIETVYSLIIILLIAYVAYKVFDEVVLYYAKEFAKKTETEIDDVMTGGGKARHGAHSGPGADRHLQHVRLRRDRAVGRRRVPGHRHRIRRPVHVGQLLRRPADAGGPSVQDRGPAGDRRRGHLRGLPHRYGVDHPLQHVQP